MRCWHSWVTMLSKDCGMDRAPRPGIYKNMSNKWSGICKTMTIGPVSGFEPKNASRYSGNSVPHVVCFANSPPTDSRACRPSSTKNKNWEALDIIVNMVFANTLFSFPRFTNSSCKLTLVFNTVGGPGHPCWCLAPYPSLIYIHICIYIYICDFYGLCMILHVFCMILYEKHIENRLKIIIENQWKCIQIPLK